MDGIAALERNGTKYGAHKTYILHPSLPNITYIPIKALLFAPLLLPAGELEAALAHHGLVLKREGVDEGLELRGL